MIEPSWGQIILWAVLSAAIVIGLLIGVISRVPTDYHKSDFEFDFEPKKPRKTYADEPVKENRVRKGIDPERLKNDRSVWN